MMPPYKSLKIFKSKKLNLQSTKLYITKQSKNLTGYAGSRFTNTKGKNKISKTKVKMILLSKESPKGILPLS